MSYHMQRSCGHEWQARIDHSCVPAKSCLWVTLWQRQLGNSSVDVQRSVQCDVSCRHVLAVMFLQFPQSCLGQSLESHSSQNPKQMQQNKQPIFKCACVCVCFSSTALLAFTVLLLHDPAQEISSSLPDVWVNFSAGSKWAADLTLEDHRSYCVEVTKWVDYASKSCTETAAGRCPSEVSKHSRSVALLRYT